MGTRKILLTGAVLLGLASGLGAQGGRLPEDELDLAPPVRIESRPRMAEEVRRLPGGETQVEVRGPWGRYCLRSQRDNPVLGPALASPSGEHLAVPGNCPP